MVVRLRRWQYSAHYWGLLTLKVELAVVVQLRWLQASVSSSLPSHVCAGLRKLYLLRHRPILIALHWPSCSLINQRLLRINNNLPDESHGIIDRLLRHAPVLATSICSKHLLNSRVGDPKCYDIGSVPQNLWIIAVGTTNEDFHIENPRTVPMVVISNCNPTMVHPPGQEDRRCNHRMIALNRWDLALIASTDYRAYLHSSVHATMPHCS